MCMAFALDAATASGCIFEPKTAHFPVIYKTAKHFSMRVIHSEDWFPAIHYFQCAIKIIL